MSEILTWTGNGNWTYSGKNVYSAQGISGGTNYDPAISEPSTYTTAYFNVWADGISGGEPYRVNNGRTTILLDRYGNHYSAASAVPDKYVFAVNNMHMVLAPPKPAPEPVELDPFTFRFQFSNTAYNPQTAGAGKSGGVWTKVEDTTANQWDYCHQTTNWDDEFNGNFINPNNIVDVIGAGEFGEVSSMANRKLSSSKVAGGLFGSGSSNNTSYVRSICEFNTENVKDMQGMFFHCNMMTSVPPLNTSSCSSFWSMFDSCVSLKWINGLNFTNAVHIRALAANCSLAILPDMSTIDPSRIISAAYIFQGNTMCGEFGSPGISASYSYLSACNRQDFVRTGAYKGTGSAISATNPQVAAELAMIPNGWK